MMEGTRALVILLHAPHIHITHERQVHAEAVVLGLRGGVGFGFAAGLKSPATMMMMTASLDGRKKEEHNLRHAARSGTSTLHQPCRGAHACPGRAYSPANCAAFLCAWRGLVLEGLCWLSGP